MPLIKRSGYWKDVSPTGAIADFITVWKQAGANRWRVAVCAAIVTTAIFSLMWHEGAAGPPPKPHIDYITTLAPGRSDAEILASNRAAQRTQDALAALQARRDEDVKAMYRTLGRATGIDVDAIDRKARADAAAAAKASVRDRQREAAAAEQARAIAAVGAGASGTEPPR